MNEPSGSEPRIAALSPAAELVIGHAHKIAVSNGRTYPSGEDLLLCLLIVGLMEETFIDALTRAGASANELRGEIIKLGHSRLEENSEQLAALRWHANEFWERLSRESVAGYDIDCCAFTAALLASDYLADSTRDLVIGRGLTPEALLVATSFGPPRKTSAGQPSAPRDLGREPGRAPEQPPLGLALDEVSLPELVGRERTLARVARAFGRGRAVRVVGPDGCGKSLVARLGGAISGKPAVWVTGEELAAVEPSDRGALLGALAAYLRDTGGGLVLTDADSSTLGGGLEIAAPGIPLIVTAKDAKAALPISSGAPWTEVRMAPLSVRAATQALKAWAGEPGRPMVEPAQLAASIDLATRFLGGEAALPGSAIVLLKASATGKEPVVTLEGLEEAVCYLTGLPLAIVSDAERHKLVSFAEVLSTRLIGQRTAVEGVAAAIVRRQMAITPIERPIGAFLFVGPTGVGKTELARVLAAELFGGEEALVRFDMSEFYDQHEIARFIGSPPGYLGSNRDGQLIEAVKKRRGKGGVLLLDEIEKADNRLYDFFLGALDYGVVSASNSGEKVSLREWVIIFTSNVGSGDGADARKRGALGFGGAQGDPERRAAAAQATAVKAHFRSRPEFINRLDAVISFDELGYDDLAAILDLHFARYAADYAGIGLSLELEAGLRAHLVAEASASGLGARDLVTRQFHTQIENQMTGALLEGQYYRGATFLFRFDAASGTSSVLRLMPAPGTSAGPIPAPRARAGVAARGKRPGGGTRTSEAADSPDDARRAGSATRGRKVN